MKLIKISEKNGIRGMAIIATPISDIDREISVKAGDFAIGPKIELVL